MIGYRPFSGAGSFSINALLLLAISGSVANLPDLRGRAAPEWRGHGGEYLFVDLWQPFIHNPAAGEPGPRCPGQSGGNTFDIRDWTLPERFDTGADSSGPHFACVRLDPRGRVREVRTLGPPHRDLARTIQLQWRFSHRSGFEERAEWHRVRLTRQPLHAL
jgi:hypothetical protein